VLGDARDKYYNRLRFEVLFCSVLVKGELGDLQVGVPLVATARQYFRFWSGINEQFILRRFGWRKVIALIAMFTIVTFLVLGRIFVSASLSGQEL
jgi:hypothetical protein